ncbi:hypothetical protein V2J09_002804 [Rumex salicifolius]
MGPQSDRKILEKRPGILVIGAPSVGKRTLLSRLLSVDFEDVSDSSSEVLAQGWTINTKYYTADVSIWMAHLQNEFSAHSLPNYDQLAALVMVFDMNDLSTLAALKDWVSHTNIQDFDILVCIGNKVDLIAGHRAHVEYRRHILKQENAFINSVADSTAYGISETEGSSLLEDEETSWEERMSFLEWFSERNIEFIEACASNADFDKCLSVDGDLQGVERLYGALTAHMWPGMVLKSGNKIAQPSLPERKELSEEEESEEDYEVEYEVLSGGSAEAWNDAEEVWISAVTSTNSTHLETGESSQASEAINDGSEPKASPSGDTEHESIVEEEQEKGPHLELEELEQLMSEIGNMRENLRLMPDFQRREMAAEVAMRMATMFGEENSEDEEGFK